MYELNCPHCKTIFEVPDSYIYVECPNCGYSKGYWDTEGKGDEYEMDVFIWE